MKKERKRITKQRSRQRIGTKKELESQRKSYQTNSHRKNYKKKCYEKEKEKKYDSALNHAKFHEAIKYGPIFICVCCQKGLFKEQVKILTEKLKKNIKPEVLEDSCDFNEERMDPLRQNNDYVCHNCYQVMSKNKKVPKLSVKNGLFVEKIPPQLQLTNLENQCISRNILFMKIKQLPKSGMKGMVDRTVCVPIEDTEIMNTITKLPRTLESSAVVGVDFKRMKNMKNVHVKGFIRPTKLFEALVTLKVLGNPHYQTVIKKCLYCPKEFADDDIDMFDHIKQCLMNHI